jgi:uncharacterized membrane protein
VRSRFCESEIDVKNAIKDFQESLTPQNCRNYINKLKEVIEVVIKNEGGRSNR